MIDGKRLLDQFLGANAGGNAGGQPGGGSLGGGSLGGLGDLLGGALGGGGQAGGGLGGLGDLLGGALGGTSSGGGKSGGLGDVVGQVTDYAKNNPGLSTVIAGGLASVLLGGKGPKLKADALTLGGLAAIGTLAYKAYQQYKTNNPGAPAQPAPTQSPLPGAPAAQSAAEDEAALSIIVAMIAAAKADGNVDADERQRILGKLAENGLTAEEQAFLDREIAAPLDFNKVVNSATSPEHGIQLYAASLLAITPDQPAERAYLDMLAARLGINPQLKAAIEQTVASAAA